MADEIKTEATVTEETVEETVSKADYDELNAKLAQYKKSIDKLTKEAAEKKREERAKMSEEEKARAEKAEEYERLKAEAEQNAIELNHLKAVTAYKGIEDATIEKLIDAVNDKDHNAIAFLIQGIVDKAVKEKEAEWKKSRPAAVVGEGGFPTMTKEQILAIKDDEKRIETIARNKDLFK